MTVLVYAPDQRQSYFRDLALSARSNHAAASRLRDHGEQMDEALPQREERARAAAEARGVEYRVNPNRTPGQGGYFAPPLWLVDAFATYPRPQRVLAALMPSFLLPSGVQSVNLPRLTIGSEARVTQDGGAVPSRDITDVAVTSPVVTIAGQGDFPLQQVEQSPAGPHLDWAIYKDLTSSYDHHLELALLSGTGANGQFYGILNLPTGAGGVNAVTYTDSSPTQPELYPFLGQAAAQIGNTRDAPPEVWLMSTSRWSWIATADTNLLTGDRQLASFPVALDDAMPTNVGATGQDAIIACRPSDMMLFESDHRSMVDFESLSGTLQARFQLRGYVAALVGRYPTGIATITGSGMAIQSGF